jgi:hypothetical protein
VGDPLDDARRALEDTALRGPGRTPRALREAVAGAGADVPAELRALVDKIERHAYRVTDEDLAALKTRYSDDELFEVVVCAALGASMRRLDAGLRALDAADPEEKKA